MKSIFGRNRTKAYNLLVNTIDAGPFDGGCVVVAQALQLRFGGEIFVLTRFSGAADHAVLRTTSGVFCDGDGVATDAADILMRFNRNECTQAVAVRPLRDGDLDDAPRDLGLSERVAKLIPASFRL